MAADETPCFRRGEGRSYRIGRITLTFKLGDVNAAYSVCESVSDPGSAGAGAGLHRHAGYEETHIVVEGDWEFQLGDETVRLGPGDMAFIPKGMAHGFKKVSDGTGRQLLISSPAGLFEAFMAEIAGVDSGSPTRASSTDFRAIAAKHGVEFIDAPRA